jgi:hypothetical protein
MLVWVRDPYWIQFQQQPRYGDGFNKIPGSGFSEPGSDARPESCTEALYNGPMERRLYGLLTLDPPECRDQASGTVPQEWSILWPDGPCSEP